MPKPRGVLFDSSINVPSQVSKPGKQAGPTYKAPVSQLLVSPKRQTINFAPAIDMSFDQTSLAVDFDFIDRHTNNLLPAEATSARRTSISQRLRLVMRKSGASITESPMSQPSSRSEEELLPIPLQRRRTPTHSDSGTPNTSFAALNQYDRSLRQSRPLVDDDHTIPVVAAPVVAAPVVERPLPAISTQAAMEEAHRGLFDASSPVQCYGDGSSAKLVTPSMQSRTVPAAAVAITPFYEFNAQISAEAETAIHSSVPNTQAIFDNMSPFLSPELPRKVALSKQKAHLRADFTPIAGGGGGRQTSPPEQTSLVAWSRPSPGGSSLPVNDSESKGRVKDPVRSKKSLLNTEHEAETVDYSNETRNNGTTPRDSQRSRSSSPDVIFSQRSSRTDDWRKSNSGVSEHSVRMADVLRDLQTARGSFIDIDGFIPNGTPRAQSRSSDVSRRQSSHESKRRSRHRKSLSQPETGRRRSLRSRVSLSQSVQQPRSSFDATVLARDSRLTYDTTRAEDTIAGLAMAEATAIGSQQPKSRPESSSKSGLSILGCTPFQQTSNDSPPSANSKQPLGTAVSSCQAAQRINDIDLDSTLGSVTQTGMSPWDLDMLTRKPTDASGDVAHFATRF